MSNPYAQGYFIRQEICFVDNHGFVLGENPKEAFPIAVWEFGMVNGKRIYTHGRYFIGKDADLAALDFGDRVTAYKAEHPNVSENYNYLASAEMSGEDNYNQIDGIPNNGFKPSILEKLRAFTPEPSDSDGKNGKPPIIER